MLRGKESIAQIARNHMVSDAVLHRSRGRFFEGGKAALEFDGEAAIRQRSQQEALERKIEELQTVIGEQVVEISVLKKTVEDVKPSWTEVEAARIEMGLRVDPAVKLLGMSRTSYYRHVRGMADYTRRPRNSVAAEHRDTLREVALKRPEAGHRKIREYAVAWHQLVRGAPGSSRMSCLPRPEGRRPDPTRPARGPPEGNPGSAASDAGGADRTQSGAAVRLYRL